MSFTIFGAGLAHGGDPLAPPIRPQHILRANRFAALVHHRLEIEGPPAHAALLVAKAPIEVMVLDWPPDLDGVLLVRSSSTTGIRRAVIGLNGRHIAARRHFTFWHEVGHYLLHARMGWRGRPCAVGLGGAGPALEIEADAFAAQVLMPGPWIVRARTEAPDLLTLAELFMVSSTAMERRLRELGEAPFRKVRPGGRWSRPRPAWASTPAPDNGKMGR